MERAASQHCHLLPQRPSSAACGESAASLAPQAWQAGAAASRPPLRRRHLPECLANTYQPRSCIAAGVVGSVQRRLGHCCAAVALAVALAGATPATLPWLMAASAVVATAGAAVFAAFAAAEWKHCHPGGGLAAAAVAAPECLTTVDEEAGEAESEYLIS